MNTATDDKIFLPGEPHHFMILEPAERTVVAVYRQRNLPDDSTLIIAESNHSISLSETYRAYQLAPVFYFPLESIKENLLRKNGKTTYCPLKGHTAYYDLHTPDGVIENVAWSYITITNEDPRVEMIKNKVAFDSALISIDY